MRIRVSTCSSERLDSGQPRLAGEAALTSVRIAMVELESLKRASSAAKKDPGHLHEKRPWTLKQANRDLERD